MPELPEVETLRLKLAPKIIGHSFTQIQKRRKDLRLPLPKNFSKFLNTPIEDVERRSKYLLIHFKNQNSLIIHLGMSGRFFFTPKESPLHKHDHVIFDLNNKTHLRFRDPRRFGLITECITQDILQHKLFKNLGVEPLNQNFTGKVLHHICQNSQSPIKSTLMNAKWIVGIGNIYACESLFLAKIRPQRKSSSLTLNESQSLVKNIKKVLKKSIRLGGTTFQDFVDAYGNPGLHQIHLNVYQREGLPCRICKTPLVKIIQSGRSSFYCPQCQI